MTNSDNERFQTTRGYLNIWLSLSTYLDTVTLISNSSEVAVAQFTGTRVRGLSINRAVETSLTGFTVNASCEKFS